MNKTEEFINKAIVIHGNKYDYSKTDYKKSFEKVIITCKAHGDFIQAPGKHLQKQGCPKCAGHEKINTIQFIEKANIIHKNKYDYTKVNYINSSTKIIIICRIHGEFKQVANSHIQGYGCPKCGIIRDPNVDEFITKANQKYCGLYDYSKINYINSHEKIIIICKTHGDFEQTPSDHLNSKYGCLKCSLILRGENKKKTTEDFILEAKKVHKNIYDYSKSIYTGCEDKLIIICPNHGEFEQQPKNHLLGKGCLDCAREKLFNSRKDNITTFINKANIIHNNKYDYSLTEYFNSKIEIKIICKEHGVFTQIPSHHLQGQGCVKCSRILVSNKKKSNNDEFKKKSKLIFGDIYDYSKVDYIDTNTKVIIICKEHGNFLIRPNNHINSKQGCPKCQIKKQYSKMQIEWLNFISIKDNINIQHAENDNEFLIPNTNYKADGYCKKTNTIFEFHGNYFHGCPKFYNPDHINKTTNCTFGELYEKTLEKELKIYELGYKLITIWEYEWKNIKKSVKILQKKFKNKFIKK